MRWFLQINDRQFIIKNQRRVVGKPKNLISLVQFITHYKTVSNYVINRKIRFMALTVFKKKNSRYDKKDNSIIKRLRKKNSFHSSSVIIYSYRKKRISNQHQFHIVSNVSLRTLTKTIKQSSRRNSHHSNSSYFV